MLVSIAAVYKGGVSVIDFTLRARTKFVGGTPEYKAEV
jgi:hypothetical protein